MKLKYKNWNDISVNTFKRLRDIKTDIHSDIDALEANISLLSILCDCSEDEISGLSTSNFSKLLQQTDFLKSLPKIDIKDKYVINGKKYELFLTMQEMNVAQYIDFQTYFKDKDKYFNELLSVFLIPKGKKYNEGYNITEVINDIGEHLSILDANSIMFFFCHLISEFNKSYSKLFNQTVEEDEERGGEREVGESNNRAEERTGFGRWSWYYMVDCVSETYRCDWEKVFKMNVYEFCNVLAYRTDKKNEEKRQIEEYRRR